MFTQFFLLLFHRKGKAPKPKKAVNLEMFYDAHSTTQNLAETNNSLSNNSGENADMKNLLPPTKMRVKKLHLWSISIPPLTKLVLTMLKIFSRWMGSNCVQKSGLSGNVLWSVYSLHGWACMGSMGNDVLTLWSCSKFWDDHPSLQLDGVTMLLKWDERNCCTWIIIGMSYDMVWWSVN